MAAALVHRGPDDEGIELIEGPEPMRVGLCVRRLMIQDPSPAGRQPMASPATGNRIAFNGEIYNVGELRQELQARGRDFRGHSDTEVVLAGYDEWGIAVLERLRGMFAFALWDAAEGALVIARDRLGIKPLYLYEGPPGLVFASEIRALLETALVPRRLSLPGLSSYLAFGAPLDPLTIVERVTSMPAGHYATWQGGRLRLRRYWDLADAFSRTDPDVPRQRAAERLRELLEETVSSHLVSDVPLGVFLSGGIDSSALVGLVARVASEPPRTASVVFPQRQYSEEPFIRRISERFGTEHSQVSLSGEAALAEVPCAVNAMDQPTFDGVNTYIVSRLAREGGLTVALSGVGGDELFAGYDTFRIVPRLDALRRRVPRVASPLAGAAARRVLGDTDRARKLARWLGDPVPRTTAYATRRELFDPDATAALVRGANGAAARAHELPDRGADVNAVSELELGVYMRNVLLRDSDVMSMAHGLEIRVPFVDHRLVEFVAGLPGELKASGNGPKPLLVEALQDLLPGEVVGRRKMGFTLPFADWLRGSLENEVAGVLTDPDFGGQVARALDPTAVGEVWGRFRAGKAHWVRPWSLYVLKRWGERQLG